MEEAGNGRPGEASMKFYSMGQLLLIFTSGHASSWRFVAVATVAWRKLDTRTTQP